MSLAEEMLATMPLSDDSSTYSADEEPHIVINESRQAIVPNELKTIAVTGDKNIETVTFDCVRYWDGNDLSTFAIYLNYVLPDLKTGTYIPEKITTTDGDKFYHFDWQIKNNITAKSGKISFAVTAISTKPNSAGIHIIDKKWSSIPNGDCSIALGLGMSNVPSEEEASGVLAQMSDILKQMQPEINAIKSELSEFVYVLTQNKLEQGTWENGAKAETIRFLRCQEKIYAPVGSVIEIIPNGLYYTISQYTSLSDTTPTTMGYLGGEKITIATEKPYFTIAVSNGANYSASTQIAISDYVGSVVCYKILSINDINLRINNQAGTFANALKGSKSGSAILIDDVSPVTHEMGVRVKSKNLTTAQGTYKNAANYLETEYDSKNCIRVSSGSAAKNTPIEFKPNTQYTVSFDVKTVLKDGQTSSGSDNVFTFFYSDETLTGIYNTYTETDWVHKEITSTAGKTVVAIGIYTTEFRSYSYVDINSFQLEEGTTATAYTPYVPDLTAVKVSRCGKNLLPYPYADTTKTTNGITFTDNGDGSVTISGTASNNAYFYLQKNADYGTRWMDAIDKNSANNGVYTVSSRIYYNAVNKTVTININPGTTLNETVYPQVELGVKATDYEPYITPTEYTPAADGTVNGVTSLYPNTTLTTDTDGVIIDCEYNRDINKAFAALEAAIATNNS